MLRLTPALAEESQTEALGIAQWYVRAATESVNAIYKVPVFSVTCISCRCGLVDVLYIMSLSMHGFCAGSNPIQVEYQ